MKRFLLLLCLFYLTTHLCSGQTGTLGGKVLDKEDNSPLAGASIFLLNSSDSSFYKGTTADADGSFSISSVEKGSYILKVSYVGYADLFRTLGMTGDPIFTGNLAVSRAGKLLKGIEVEDKAPTAVQKGDTTQYNSSSFKTNVDANAEDLVTKMPGITTQDGKVQAHGEDVKKVLVDGKPFFGDDPNAVLKNLPAEIIDKIQVFDQQSDQARFTGISDGNTSKTINIITRQGMKNGTFGRVFAGAGMDNVYRSGANLNFFNHDRRISVMAQSNNVNEQNFSSEDLAGVMSASGGGGRTDRGRMGGYRGGSPGGGSYRGGENSSSNFLVNTRNGIATTHAFGLNYTDKWNKKTEISASYFLNSSDNIADQQINRQYVLPGDSGRVYLEDNLSRSLNINHRANVKLEWKPDSVNSFTFQPKFSMQQNNGSTGISGRTEESDTLLNTTDNDYKSEVLAYTLSAELQFQHKFRKQGRTFAVTLNGSGNATDAGSELYAANSFYGDSASSSVIDQQSFLARKGNTIGSNTSYTEPFSSKSMLQVSYVNSFNFTENDKRTYNFSALTSDYSSQDTLLSNVFKTEYASHKPGLTYRYNGSKLNLNIGVHYQLASLSSRQSFPYAYGLKKDFEDLLPSATLRYNFSGKKSLRMHYRTQTTQPSAEQLQNVLNNSNPLQLSMGNPDLRQNYEHSLFTRYSATNTEKASAFFAMLAGTYTLDHLTSSTWSARNDTTLEGVFLPRGAQLSKPVNQDGYINIRSFLIYSFPLSFIKTNLNISVNASFTRTPGLINGETNYADAQNYGGGLTFSSNISKEIDFTLSTNSSYSITENTLSRQLNTSYLNQTSRFKLNLTFLKSLVLNTDLTHQYYSGLSEGFDQNFLLWNAGLGYKFLKDDKAELRFSVNDILGQNASVSRNTSETYLEDVSTTVLQRYYMLTFTYNIRMFGERKPEEK